MDTLGLKRDNVSVTARTATSSQCLSINYSMCYLAPKKMVCNYEAASLCPRCH